MCACNVHAYVYRCHIVSRRQKTFHFATIVEDYRAAARNIRACDGDGRRAVPGAFSGAPRAVEAHGGLWAACCSYWQRPEQQQLAVALGGAPQVRERGRAGRAGEPVRARGLTRGPLTLCLSPLPSAAELLHVSSSHHSTSFMASLTLPILLLARSALMPATRRVTARGRWRQSIRMRCRAAGPPSARPSFWESSPSPRAPRGPAPYVSWTSSSCASEAKSRPSSAVA